MPVGNNGGTDRRILIIRPVMFHHIVGQAPVIPESRFLSQEFLIDPLVKHLTNRRNPVAGKRAAQAHDRQ